MNELPPGYKVRERPPQELPEGYTVKQGQPVDFDVGEMVGNIPDSTGQFIDDITYPFRHPVVTAGAIKNLALGIAEKAGVDITEGDQEQYVDAVGQYLKGRYGGIDNFKKSLMDDPVGVASDIGGVLTGGAGLTAKIPSLTKATKLLNVAGHIEPVRLLNKGIKTAAQPFAKHVDVNDIYQEVMKFGTTKKPSDRRAWAQTGLDERIVPNQKGLDKLDSRIETLTNDLNTAIDSPAGQSAAVPVERVLQNIPELRQDKGGFRRGAQADVDSIDQFVDEFMDEHWGRGEVSARDLQGFKQDAYDKINWNAKRNTGTPLDEDINRATGRAAKEGIEEVLPEVAEINQQLGNALDAQGPIKQSTGRISNRGKLSLPGAVVAGGAAAAEPAALVPALGGALLFNPEMKAKAAIIIDQLAKNGGRADLLESGLLRGLTNGQVRQLVLQSGRLGQENQPDQAM